MELQYIKALEGQVGGFNYDNCLRNKALIESKTENKTSLQYTKTGTTICGVVFKVSINNFQNKLGYRMEYALLPIPGLQVVPLSETKIASKFIILPQISILAELVLLLIAITSLRESRESSRCIDSILTLRTEFKWLLVDFPLRLSSMEEISEPI